MKKEIKFQDIDKVNQRNCAIAVLIALLIMIAIFALSYVIAHNVNTNPFYNH